MHERVAAAAAAAAAVAAAAGTGVEAADPAEAVDGTSMGFRLAELVMWRLFMAHGIALENASARGRGHRVELDSAFTDGTVMCGFTAPCIAWNASGAGGDSFFTAFPRWLPPPSTLGALGRPVQVETLIPRVESAYAYALSACSYNMIYRFQTLRFQIQHAPVRIGVSTDDAGGTCGLDSALSSSRDAPMRVCADTTERRGRRRALRASKATSADEAALGAAAGAGDAPAPAPAPVDTPAPAPAPVDTPAPAPAPVDTPADVRVDATAPAPAATAMPLEAVKEMMTLTGDETKLSSLDVAVRRMKSAMSADSRDGLPTIDTLLRVGLTSG